MRKASQDGGDTTSITSGFESDAKKPGAGIIKSKRNSIKRKVQHFSLESDDAVIEPLLQRDKEKIDIGNQSAKSLLSKAKTESTSDKGNDMDKLLDDNKLDKPSITNVPGITDISLANGIGKPHTNSYAPIHNHMNTNVFSSQEGGKCIGALKSQVLVEIDSNYQLNYNPSPLIFTTAKIHTDGKNKHMEPVQVTPVPILSTVEGNIIKAGTIASDKASTASNKKEGLYDTNASIIHYSLVPDKNTTTNESNERSTPNNTFYSKSNSSKILSAHPTVLMESTSKGKPIAINDSVKTSALHRTPFIIQDTAITTIFNKESKMLPLEKHFKSNNTTEVAGHSGRGTVTTNGLRSSILNESKIDINKNIEATVSIDSRIPETSKIVNNKLVHDVSVKISTTASNSGNKSLQRQKNATIDDPNSLKDITTEKCDKDVTKKLKDDFLSKKCGINITDSETTSRNTKISTNLIMSQNSPNKILTLGPMSTAQSPIPAVLFSSSACTTINNVGVCKPSAEELSKSATKINTICKETSTTKACTLQSSDLPATVTQITTNPTLHKSTPISEIKPPTTTENKSITNIVSSPTSNVIQPVTILKKSIASNGNCISIPTSTSTKPSTVLMAASTTIAVQTPKASSVKTTSTPIGESSITGSKSPMNSTTKLIKESASTSKAGSSALPATKDTKIATTIQSIQIPSSIPPSTSPKSISTLKSKAIPSMASPSTTISLVSSSTSISKTKSGIVSTPLTSTTKASTTTTMKISTSKQAVNESKSPTASTTAMGMSSLTTNKKDKKNTENNKDEKSNMKV